MQKSKLLHPLLISLSLVLLSFSLPRNLDKKVQKEVTKVFDIETFEMKVVEVPSSLNAQLPTSVNGGKLNALSKGGKRFGYVFVDQAPSKTAKFDYLVIFDENLQVVHSKVLVYREEYGGEIGSRRWLRQFEGLNGNDRVSLKTNIDAISGATISVRSMTNAMDKLLQTIGILDNEQLL